MWSFLFGSAPNVMLLMLYLFTSQLLPSTIILKIFSKRSTTREHEKLVLTRFDLENIISSLALETGAVII